MSFRDPTELNDDLSRLATEQLRLRMESVIFKFGFKHGIPTHEARHLLLNTGVRIG